MSEEQTPVEVMPPASRLGEILGWSLLVLAVACFVAFIVAAVRADSASKAMQHADAAFTAAYNAYREAQLFTYLSLTASLVFLSLIPGLLYASKPSLLGGPLGRLFRLSSAKLAQRQPQRRHPVTFYQGIGVVLISIPGVVINLGPAVTLLIPAVWWWLTLLWMLLIFPSYLVGLSLFGQATWWYTSRQRAGRGQERPQA